MKKVKDVLDVVLRTICVVLFALLVLLVSWQVFTRLVLGNPSVWSEEAARYTFIWLSLIGISIATGEKADVAIDFFVQKVPVALQRWFEVSAYLSTISFAIIVMIWGGYLNSSLAWAQRNPVLPINAGVLYLAVPVAGGLFAFYLLYHLIRTLAPSYSGAEQIAAENEVAL